MASDNPVYSQIRRSNRNTLLLTLALLVVLIVGVVLAVPYWTRTLTGPHSMTADEVVALSETALPLYSVKISGDEMFDVGYEEYTTTNGVKTSTDAYFGVLAVGEKLLMIRSDAVIDEGKLEYTGTLLMPTGVGLEAVNELKKDVPDAAPALLPFILDAKDENFPWLLGAGALVI